MQTPWELRPHARLLVYRNVSYNGKHRKCCPNTFLVSSRVNWEPYFEYAINCVAEGTQIDADWTGTLEDWNLLKLSELGTNVAEGTKEAIDAAAEAIKAGTLHVFDTTTFTVEGAELTATKQMSIPMQITHRS